MEIRFECECYERTLVIEFPSRYYYLQKQITECLEQYYNEWVFCETEDVEDVCLEEYMMERLSEIYNMWIEWRVEED